MRNFINVMKSLSDPRRIIISIFLIDFIGQARAGGMGRQSALEQSVYSLLDDLAGVFLKSK